MICSQHIQAPVIQRQAEASQRPSMTATNDDVFPLLLCHWMTQAACVRRHTEVHYKKKKNHQYGLEALGIWYFTDGAKIQKTERKNAENVTET